MAWSITQGVGATATQVSLLSGTATTTLSITPTAIGSFLFLTGTVNASSTIDTYSASDSVDGAWTMVQVNSGSGAGQQTTLIAYRDNASSTAARTVTLSRTPSTTNDFVSWALGEATHSGITFATDGSASAGSGGTTGGATVTVSGPTPTLANGLVIAVGGNAAGSAWANPASGDTGWSAIQSLWSITASGAGDDGRAVAQIYNSTSALSTIFTETGGTFFPVGSVLVFKGPASGGTVDNPRNYQDELQQDLLQDADLAASEAQLGIPINNRDQTIGAAFSSSGVGTVAAVGRSTASGNITSTGLATVTGAGASTAAGAGSIAGTLTVQGVGASTASGVVSETATATVQGVGASTASGAISETAAATVLGVGASTAAAVFSETGAATVLGVGQSTASGDFNSAGVLSATMVPAGSGTIVAGDGSINGTATVQGVGVSTAAGVITETAAATVSGAGASTAAADITSAGVAIVTGVGRDATANIIVSAAGSIVMTGDVKGVSAATAARRRAEGRIPHRQQQRRRDDEQDLLDIAATLAPLVSQGGPLWLH